MNIYTDLDEATWLSLRKKNLNSSEVAALFDMSPYKTAYELWHEKKGTLADGFKMNDRVEAGQFLEPAIGAWASHRLGLQAAPFKDYYEDADARTGSSFDWLITSWPGCPAEAVGNGLMEIKNVDFQQFHGSFKNGFQDRKWNADDPENVMAPPHIELQVQHQLMVTGLQWALIVACVGGNTLYVSFRLRNETIIGKIRSKIAAFWASIEADAEPDFDASRDADAVRAIYARPDPRAALDDETRHELEHHIALATDAGAAKKAAEADETTAKANVMKLLGGCELVACDNGAKASWKANKNGTRVLRLTAAPAAENMAIAAE